MLGQSISALAEIDVLVTPGRQKADLAAVALRGSLRSPLRVTVHRLHIAKIQGYFIMRGVGYKALH